MSFTSDFPKYGFTIDEHGDRVYKSPVDAYKKRDGVMQVYEQFSLMNMFSSKTKVKELEYQMKTIFRVAEGFSRTHYTFYSIPNGLSLSGTPLNDTLICLHEIIPQFKKQNNLEKVQCVILTDGEAPPLKYHKTVQRHWESEPYLGVRQVSLNCILRDRKLGTTYSLGGNWYELTDVLLTHLKDKFKDTNFIGIRVLKVVMLTASLLVIMVDGMMIMIAFMLLGGRSVHLRLPILDTTLILLSLQLPWHRTTPLMSKKMQLNLRSRVHLSRVFVLRK